MSMTLNWLPVAKKKNGFSKSRHLLDSLERVFGQTPLVLDCEALPDLRVMVNCGFDDLETVIDAIANYGKIEISEDY